VIAQSTCCLVCGERDALGAGICANCATAGDTLVMVRRQSSAADRRDVGARLAVLLGERLELPDGRAAAAGDRALVRASAVVGARIAGALEEHGIPARTVPRVRAWSVMPAHFFVMLAAIVGAGGAAGVIVVPAYLWMSPLLAALLLLIAQRSAGRPLFEPVASALEPGAEAALLDALASLRHGRARELLGDIARIARPLALTIRSEGDPAELGACLADLVRAAAATALEVDRLEETIAVLEDGGAAGAATTDVQDFAPIIERCRAAAGIGTRQLVEAVTAVGQIGGMSGLDTRAGSRLAELTRELQAAARTREDTIRELDRLLSRS
jgi:hypothetical protein